MQSLGRLGAGFGVMPRGFVRHSGGAPVPPAVTHESLLFDASGGDYLTVDASTLDIFNGVLMECWTRNPQPAGYPFSQENKSPFTIHGVDWFVWCITGNMYTEVPDEWHAGFNQNITLWGGMGDRLGMITTPVPVAQCLDWVWNAWRFHFSGVTETDTCTFQQWCRLGLASPYIFKEVIHTVAEIRTLISDPTWVPSQPTYIDIGQYSAYGPAFSMTKVRVRQSPATPTEAELSAMCIRNDADTSAWLDIASEWVDGAAVFTDRSGNGNTPTMVGTITQGLNADGAWWSGQPYIRQSTPVTTTGSLGTGTLVGAFPSALVAGNFVICEGGCFGGIEPTISDTQSNIFVRRNAMQGSGYWATYPYVAYAEVGASAADSVQMTGNADTRNATIRGHEWVGIDTTTPEDFYVTSAAPAEPLTLTAPTPSTIAGIIGVSSIVGPNGGFNAPPVGPSGSNYITGVLAIAGGSGGTYINARTRYGAPATHSITWPDQVGDVPMSGVFVGFRPAS